MNIVLLILLALTTLGPANVRCLKPGTPTQELSKATAVFSGKVIGRDYIPEENSSGEIGQRLVIKIAVQRVWKGDIYFDETMYTSEIRLPNGLTQFYDEDFHFQDNKEYLIYAFGKRDHLATDACTRSRELSKAADDLNELGNGHEPQIHN